MASSNLIHYWPESYVEGQFLLDLLVEFVCVCVICFVLKHQVQAFEDPGAYHHYTFKI